MGTLVRSMAFALIAFCLSPFAAQAQISSNEPPPRTTFVDEIGFDLQSLSMIKSTSTLTIGAANAPALAYTIFNFNSSSDKSAPLKGALYFYCDNDAGYCEYIAQMGNKTGNFLDLNSDLSWDFTATGATVTERDGTVWNFTNALARPWKMMGNAQEAARLTSVVYPNNVQLSYIYASDNDGQLASDFARSITTNYGYQAHFDFAPAKYGPIKATLINLAIDYCDPTAVTCSASSASWPTVSFSPSNAAPHTATDTLGRTAVTTGWYLQSPTIRKLDYTSPGGATLTMRHDKYTAPGYPCSTGCWSLTQIQLPFGTWMYDTKTLIPTSTNPAGGVTTFTANTPTNRTSLSDGLGRATEVLLGRTEPGFGSGTPRGGELGGIIYPAGNRVDWSYDQRFNRTMTTARPAPGLGGSPLVSTMQFPVSCTAGTQKVCNQPDYMIDARGLRTDYTYDFQHGGILTQTMPADASGVRPQIRYTYQQLSALYKNSAGQLVPGPSMWKVVATSACRTQTSCVGSADEVVTETQYNGNLLPQSETVRAGDNSLISTVTRQFDEIGNIIRIDGPAAGAADSTYFFWDAARQPIGEILPDPDGVGPLPRPATKRIFDADGKLTSLRSGSVTDTTLAALNAMATDREVVTIYDVGGRKVREEVQSGGVIYALDQYSYDLAGRVECAALRMNAAIYSALPISACTLGAEGSEGPDRITKNVYDVAGQLVKVQKAFSTPLQQDYVSYTFSPNGQPTSVIDANGNMATMIYDGHDRLGRWTFPSLTTPGQASASDYEEYGYDANGNRTSLRKRDGQAITYTYDALNRVTLKDLPGGTTKDVHYGYDLAGLETFARFETAAGAGINTIYDAFGRVSSSTNTMGGTSRTLSYSYDATGNRSRVVHPDGQYFDYTYDALNRVTALVENGSAEIVTLIYNAKGERAGITNGGTTNYGYDPVGRLASFGLEMAGTEHDVTTTFGHNPASQVTTRSRTNGIYEFKDNVNVSRSYVVNGLNQYVSAGPASFAYDGNGNLTSDGSSSFAYDIENRLVSATGAKAANLIYDPLGRLFETNPQGSVGAVRYLYDGHALVAEYDGAGALLKRYVHGPGDDQPLVSYEGATLATRYAMKADHQGSIIAVTDSVGNVAAIQTYDPYGIPGASNAGRFQYTGHDVTPVSSSTWS